MNTPHINFGTFGRKPSAVLTAACSLAVSAGSPLGATSFCRLSESNNNYYCKCPKCPDFLKKADSLKEVQKLLELHEKDLHDSKQVGIFGVSYKSYKKESN